MLYQQQQPQQQQQQQQSLLLLIHPESEKHLTISWTNENHSTL